MIIRAKAPLRISFAGGGTDVSPYPEERGGATLTATINRYAYVTLLPEENGPIEIQSLDYNTTVKYETFQQITADTKLALVKAVINRFWPQISAGGFRVYLHSDAPPGSGVGSSSTLVVALLGAFKEWLRLPLSKYAIAKLSYEIERIDVGIKGGWQDQYAATFGGFNFIEYYRDMTIVNPLNIPPEIVNELQYRLLLCYTGGSRLSSNIIAKQMKRYEQHDRELLAALDRLKVLAGEMRQRLVLGDLEEFGRLLHASWECKKQVVDDVTNARINEIYDQAIAAGAIGGKISGAGGGGYMYFFCPFEKKPQVAEALDKLGCSIIDFNFELGGLQTWRTPVVRREAVGAVHANAYTRSAF